MCTYRDPKLREVDCSSLIREALRDDGKKVFVPIVDDRNSNVRFLRVRDPVEKDLEKRTMGIGTDGNRLEDEREKGGFGGGEGEVRFSHNAWVSVR